jgi:hypothetical protein
MQAPANIGVPFLRQSIGLGDLVAGAANAMGIQSTPDCGCQKRKDALNRAVQFNPYRG